jgi:hypothetical protein
MVVPLTQGRIDELRTLAAAGNVAAGFRLGDLLTERGHTDIRWPAQRRVGAGRRATTDTKLAVHGHTETIGKGLSP